MVDLGPMERLLFRLARGMNWTLGAALRRCRNDGAVHTAAWLAGIDVDRVKRR